MSQHESVFSIDHKQEIANFLDHYGATQVGNYWVGQANTGTPLLARMDGSGPNAPVVSAQNNPELAEIVKDKQRHARSIATVALNQDGKQAFVHLQPASGATISTDYQIIPVNFFGRPISPLHDYGLPLNQREGEKFDALVSALDLENVQGHLYGLYEDSATPIGGMNGQINDANRFAMPIVVFGRTKGEPVIGPLHIDSTARMIERVAEHYLQNVPRAA